jgi:hypothetical protein
VTSILTKCNFVFFICKDTNRFFSISKHVNTPTRTRRVSFANMLRRKVFRSKSSGNDHHELK